MRQQTKHLRQILLLPLLLCLFSFQAKAQLFEKLDKGIHRATRIEASCSDNKHVYAAALITPYQAADNFAVYSIARWNGYAWAYLPDFKVYGFNNGTSTIAPQIKSLAVHNGHLFICGLFDKVNNLDNSRGIVMWNTLDYTYNPVGSGLQFITGTQDNARCLLSSYQGKLYVVAPINKVGAIQVNGMATWDNNTWSYPGAAASAGVQYDQVYDMAVHNGKLFIAGSFNSVDAKNISLLAAWNGSYWNDAGLSVQDSIPAFSNLVQLLSDPDNNSLYALSNSQYIVKLDGADQLSVLYKNASPAYTVPSGQLFTMQGQVYAFVQENTQYKLALLQAFNWLVQGSALPISTGQRIMHLAYGNKHITLSESIRDLNLDPTYNFAAGFSTGKGIVKGKLYADLNNNCSYDNGEPVMAQKVIEFSPGNVLSMTDDEGNYEIALSPGTYSISPLNIGIGSVICSSMNINLPIGALLHKDIPVKPSVSVKDLSVKVCASSGPLMIRNTREYYTIFVDNLGGETVSSAEIVMTHSGKLNGFGSNDAISYLNNTAKFNVSNLLPGSRATFRFSLQIPPTLADTDQTSIYCSASSYPGDTKPENNADTLVQTPKNNYNPNYKTCSPNGEIKPSTTKIDYFIHFQNTWRDTARWVLVIDTVDINLPLTQVSIIGSSHPGRLAIVNNVLLWRFDNINMPDSATNVAKSKGWIRYAAILKPGLAIGTEIFNRAHVFFDYRNSAASNTASNKIVDKFTGQGNEPIIRKNMRIYPNPAAGELNIENTGTESSQYCLYDLVGRALIRLELAAGESIRINTRQLADGCYFLQNENGSSKIIIRH